MSLPPALALPLDYYVEGEVVHISKDGKQMWFTPISLLPVVKNLRHKLALIQRIPVSQVKVGQVCITMYSIDSELYRARITEVNENKVEVLFVDYGNEEVKSIDEIMEIPEDYLELVPTALPINTARAFNKMQRREVEDLLCGEQVKVKLSEERGVEVVRIFDNLDCEIRFGAECLQEGVETAANLGYVESVGVVWVVPTDVQEKLNMVTNILAEQKDWKEETDIFVGKMCVAKYSEDHEMYRAMVIKLLGAENVLVRFIDFGNSEETSDLWKLPSELLCVEDCAVRVNTRWRMNDSISERELEEQLGKEEFLVKVDQSDGLATFSRGECNLNKYPDNEANGKSVEDLLDKENLVVDMRSNELTVDDKVIKFLAKGPSDPTHLKFANGKEFKFIDYLNQDIEYLREDPNQTSEQVLELDDVLADSEKDREVDGSAMDMVIPEKPPCLEVFDDSAVVKDFLS